MSAEQHFFAARDGERLAYYTLGDPRARSLLLIHGYMSDAATNWMKFVPTATMIADAGFHVIMPDLRAHGHSAKPHNPTAYPTDILADDQFALIDHLGIDEFDLGGYSLGGRTVARMLARGARPGRAIIAGMGLSGVTDVTPRTALFRHILRNLGQHERGSAAWMAEAFLKTSGGDPVALDMLQDSYCDTSPAELSAIETRVGVVCGADDRDNGSAANLADQLPNARYYEIPGNHMSAVTKPELAASFITVLTD